MSSDSSLLRRWLGVELIAVSPVERWVSALGGFLGILGLVLVMHWLAPGSIDTCLVASMGASAVLLFAAPHGQLSQPWPVVGGHALSALVGVACARWIREPVFAGAAAVGLAIGVMHLFRCIHPPGGATALTAVTGGTALHELGFQYVLFPVLTSAMLLVLLAILINAPFPWRRYPSALNRWGKNHPAPGPDEPTHAEVLAAIRSMDSFIDIDEEDLLRLVALLSSQRQP